MAAGEETRVGPDGVETLVPFNLANRVTLLRRGPVADPFMQAAHCVIALQLH